MKNKIFTFFFLCFSLLADLAISFSVNAKCTSTKASQTEDNRAAFLPFGRVNLTDKYLQPVGSVLASVVVPATAYNYGGANGSTVLWTCDKSDLSSLYFLVATNGDDRVGGFFDIGKADGLSDVYATKFAYVGIRQSMLGVPLTRYWKKIPIISYREAGSKIQIRLSDIPPLQAELIRVSTRTPKTGAASNFCWLGVDLYEASAAGTTYACNQPNAYVTFVGPGITHDEIGQDSSRFYKFFLADNGFGYRMQNTVLTNTPTCVVRSADNNVYFLPISAMDLNRGQTSEATFSVQVECSNSAKSGIYTGQTSIGIQVSSGAERAAKKLGLRNNDGSVSMLLSDNYGSDTDLAKGVGIKLRNAQTQKLMSFVGTNSRTSGGWYPILDGATVTGSSYSGYKNYQQQYIATLTKIPGQTVTPGKVKATAYVLVKIQ